jgi:hypothetical protein
MGGIELLPPPVTWLAKNTQAKRQAPLCYTASWSLRKKVANKVAVRSFQLIVTLVAKKASNQPAKHFQSLNAQHP